MHVCTNSAEMGFVGEGGIGEEGLISLLKVIIIINCNTDSVIKVVFRIITLVLLYYAVIAYLCI